MSANTSGKRSWPWTAAYVVFRASLIFCWLILLMVAVPMLFRGIVGQRIGFPILLGGSFILFGARWLLDKADSFVVGKTQADKSANNA